MLAFNEADINIFNELLESLTIILSDPSVIKKLIEVNTFTEFIELLIENNK